MFPYKHIVSVAATILTLGVATQAPVAAQSVIVVPQSGFYGANPQPFGAIYGGSYSGFYRDNPQPVSSFIYGSPIPTPMPVNPVTGHSTRSTNDFGAFPRRRSGSVVNSTLLNPILINPTIQDSTLVNPIIVNPEQRRDANKVQRGSSMYLNRL